MNNSFLLLCAPMICNRLSSLARRLSPSGIAVLVQIPALLIPCTAIAQSSVDSETGSPILFFVFFAMGIIGLSVILIVGLTRWGHKQEQIQNMMPFCIRYLVESKNESEKIEAATALGGAKDPGALLILADIVNDDEASIGLRDAAGAALRKIGQKHGKYTRLIDASLSAVAEKDHQKTIELLTKHFENGRSSYVQSAYVIGREYMRMKQYSDARHWLQHARIRNLKKKVYFNQISRLIDTCNQHLFSEGDVFFKVGEYYDALERFALASHELSLKDKQQFSAHVRLACTYCKLENYDDAYQETLHALQDHHKTDISLLLNKLIQEIRGEIGGTSEAQQRRNKLRKQIDSNVISTMDELI